MGRFFKSLVALAVIGGSVLVGSTAAVAADSTQTDSFQTDVDEQNDNGPSKDAQGDIESAGAAYGADAITLTLRTRTPVDPATDDNWVQRGSGIVWTIEVFNGPMGNSNADFQVVMSSGATGPSATVQSLTSGADLCAATPLYGSDGAIQVTFDASCIGRPTTFRFYAVHDYYSPPSCGGLFGCHEVESHDRAPESFYCCYVFAPTPSMSPAPGTTKISPDPLGDAASWYADIGEVGVSYGGATIGLGLFLIDSRSPTAWWVSNDQVIWTLDVDGDTSDDYLVRWAAGGASVHTYAGGTIGPELCRASASYSATDDYYHLGFPASCIGTPAAVRGRGLITAGSAYDYAPGESTYTPFVYRNAPAPPTKPPSDLVPPPDPGFTTAGNGSGYWMITDNGEVSPFGDAKNYGNELAGTVKRVDIEPTPSGNGYWILGESGAVYAKGDAQWLGSALTSLLPGEKAAALSSTANGLGYWIFTDRGRVLAFGTAKHFGDMSGVALNGPVLDAVATPTGNGYWMVASDGGVFTFGNARFSGSTGNIKLNKPVMSMAPDPDGSGYWLVASDGGIFAFDAAFYGSMGSTPLNKPISGIVPGQGGYMMVGEDGGIFAFGNVAFHGSLGANPPARPVVAVALMS